MHLAALKQQCLIQHHQLISPRPQISLAHQPDLTVQGNPDLIPRARAQRQWRLARILLTTTGVAAVIVFALVVVPALGSAYDGFRNVVIIVFANLQIVAIIGQVPGVEACCLTRSCAPKNHSTQPTIRPHLRFQKANTSWLLRTLTAD